MIKRTDCSMNSGWMGFLGDFLRVSQEHGWYNSWVFNSNQLFLGILHFETSPLPLLCLHGPATARLVKCLESFWMGKLCTTLSWCPCSLPFQSFLVGLFLLTLCSHTHSDISVFMEQLLYRMLSVDPSTGRMLTIWNHIWLVVLVCFSPIIWKILS